MKLNVILAIQGSLLLSCLLPMQLKAEQTDSFQVELELQRQRVMSFPAISYEQLMKVEIRPFEKPVLRQLNELELIEAKRAMFERKALEATTLRDLPTIFFGDCANDTGYWAGVYGPRVSDSQYDNELYLVPPGYRTPDGWDCDGFYIPMDVSVKMNYPSTLVPISSETHQGTGAVKFTNLQWGVLESISQFQRQIGSPYLVWRKEGDVNWDFITLPQSDLDNLGYMWCPSYPGSSTSHFCS